MVFFRPTYLIDGDITDISLDQLEQDGIKGIIFDLDSTLVAPHSGHLTEETERWLQAARLKFKLAVVSNNRNDPYIDEIRALLQMPVLHRAKKPSRKMFLQVREQFELPPRQIAVVGDRPLTDVWGGQRAGMKTVLVWPLKSMREPKLVTWIRKLERVFIKP